MVNVNKTTNLSIRSIGTTWQLLTELYVPGGSAQKRLAIEEIAETIEPFHLSARTMEQLKTAVTRAVMGEERLTEPVNPHQPASIRVMASPQAVSARSKPEKYGASGWGFFLIEKIVDEFWQGGDLPCHKIELFLYLEGEIQN